MLAVVLVSASVAAIPPLPAAAEATALRLVTGAGDGPPGTLDPLVTFSLDDAAFRPAVIADVAGRPYSVLGGSRWVSLNEQGTGAPANPVRYRLPFTLPSDFTEPALSVAVHADNVAFLELNGTAIGNQTDDVNLLANFQDPAETFRTSRLDLFLPGLNHLDVLVRNGGDPSGLDLVADVTFVAGSGGGGGSAPDPSTISLGDVTVTEGDAGTSTALIPFTVSPALRAPATVRFQTVAGSATSGLDFVATDGNLNLDNGQTSGAISIPLLPDALLERDEAFTVVLDTPSTGLVVARGAATVTIIDDDPLALEVSDVSGPEGVPLSLPIHFSSPALDPGSVVVSTTNGTASSPSDFTALDGRVITWSAGATSAAAVVALQNDVIAEGPETFQVVLSNPTGGAFIAVGSATATIVDDDLPGAAPGLSVGDARAIEGDPATPALLRFPITLTPAANFAVTFRCRTVEGGTAPSFDYTAVDVTVTLAPGTSTATCDVPMRPDLVDEMNSTVEVEVTSTSATIVDGRAVGTIEDDDPSPSNVGVEDAPTVLEGDPGGQPRQLSFRIRMSPAQKAPVSVSYAALPGQTDPAAQSGQDFVATTGTATFAPGQTSLAVLVPVVADLRGEPRESVGLAIGNLMAPGLRLGQLGRRLAQGFINDDDPQSANVGVRDAPVVLEGDPGTGGRLVFPIDVSPVQKAPLTFRYQAVAPQTSPSGVPAPASDSDFVATSGTLTVPPGTTRVLVQVPIVGDLRGEPTERLEVFLSDLRSDGAGSPVIGRRVAQGIISDDDPTAVNVGLGDAGRVLEGDPGSGGTLQFPVRLSPVQKTEVRVRYRAFSPSGGTPAAADDFVATSGDLVIPAGATGAFIAVPLVGDLRNEPDERIEVALSDLRTSGAPATVIGDRSGIGFIGNDDPPPPRWRIADAFAPEGSPSDPGTLRFRVSITPAQKRPVAADVSITGETAVVGSDFSLTESSVVIATGATEAFVDVPILADLDVEPDERLLARLQVRDGAVDDGTATGSITNDDLPPGVSISDARGPEGTESEGAVTFVVSLAFPVSTEVSVGFNTLLVATRGTSNATAGDLTRISGTLVFAPGETQRLVTVNPSADRLAESDEIFLVRLLNPSGVQLADRDGVGTIVDDDRRPLPAG